MQPTWRDDKFGIELYLGDCMDVMPHLDKVDAVVTDPPYFKVKKDEWDNQWAKVDGFLGWLDAVLSNTLDVMNDNASLYVFASPDKSTHVEHVISSRFHVLNRIKWVKDAGWHKKTRKEDLRRFLTPSEDIIFAEIPHSDSIALGESQYGAKCDRLRGFIFEPLRAYLASEWKRAGLKYSDANEACGTANMAGRHFFSVSQWCLPTAEHYEKLQAYANRNGSDFLRREYEDLRREYEDLRREYEDLRREYEDLRRPFCVSEHVPHTDVWNFKPVPARKGKHPCEKPIKLIRHICEVSTRDAQTILDPFMGSGTTGVAAVQLGRKFIGIEKDPEYFQMCVDRISQSIIDKQNGPMFAEHTPEPLQLELI